MRRIASFVWRRLPRGRAFWVLLIAGGCFLFSTADAVAQDDPGWVDGWVEMLVIAFFGEAAGEAVSAMSESVLCALKGMFCWAVYFIADLVLDLVEAHEDLLPDLSEWNGLYEDMFDWLDWANGWIPFGWFVVFMGLYFGWYVFVVIAKWILKLIPTMG